MSKRVLVCDDSKVSRQVIVDSLVQDGWEIVGEAGNGREAIEKYQETKPDAITLDLSMPESDGFEAIEAIRKLDPDAKIVVVSSNTQQELISEIISMGACDFVTKPFVSERLQESLAACLATCID